MSEIVGACLSQFHGEENQFEFLIAYSDGREIGHSVSRSAAQEIASTMVEAAGGPVAVKMFELEKANVAYVDANTVLIRENKELLRKLYGTDTSGTTMNIVAYACSSRPNALWSAAQFDNALPKNRTECDVPLVTKADAERAIAAKVAEIEALRSIVERAQAIISTSIYPNWHDAASAALKGDAQ